MNFLDWNGPEFLVFYLILATVCLVAQYWIRRTREAADFQSGDSTPPLNDPYLVSYLAGQANGLIRCVTVSLLERKVLRVSDADKKRQNELVMDPEVYQSQAPSQVEAAVARFFVRPRAAHEVFAGVLKDPAVRSAGEQYQAMLESAGMMPNPQQRSANRSEAWLVVLILALVAGLKLFIAIEAGRKNVDFLIILAIFACVGAGFMARVRPTVRGKAALADLQHLFSGLKDQTKAGIAGTVSPADVAFVAAVFGLGALGGARELYAKQLFPSASSSCGSGCGSSGGDSGGSSCGGSGCGGCGGG